MLQIPGQQCALVAIIVFIIVGFQRGWRRELVSLVFIMLATLLIHPDTSDALGAFLGRLPTTFAVMTGQPAPAQTTASSTGFLGGPFWSLVIFGGLVVLGYYTGDKVFPRPSTPQERFIGIIPAIIAGAFIISYMTAYLRSANLVTNGGRDVSFNFTSPDPANYVPIVVVIGIIALVGALIAARVKRASGGKK